MLQVYRIDRSLCGKIGHFLKDPPLPPVAASAFKIGNPLQVFRDITTDNVFILHKEDEIKRFRDPNGRELLDDTYYIRHPKKQRTDCLIPATTFHRYIVQEQIHEIISYVRSNTFVKQLKVSISRSSGGKLDAKSIIEELPIEGKIELKFTSTHEVIIQSEIPLKPSEKRKEYIWMDDFQSTVATVDSIASAHFGITDTYNMSFGMNLDLAQQIGVSAEWLSTYKYELQCEVA